ncbi:sigma54-dependent response regulator [Campylobacter pinnipediorum subsp. pinnipediorum]|uniref:AAA family ATPase n=1 Tax=Campylobacter pinnipediorum subsp. pinnipediorum TaxID=1660067 RepID=A0AAX0L9D1_9BACT|nr:sigma-54 dependent transcriptional regulator [Campylobacter pinnipediorum]AQW81123.1 sigma54-dependent response regulator [Campylobacter pinnipediorum subsp. pinnipediorum]AQW84428.1 sigma54-dependent response regulator [Campylobacter pinnipediorum subsp. pinnipediorum]OPA77915.1 AAA family ATPase [Campylobacter pinnipediorum subsp. pinnipediorum]OPA78075.1 AAA family ATPase [Campylobacter pinnipediorum subsp. pinnipediorum]
MNIAIVEDDINMRKSLEISLSEFQELNIKTYKNANEALKKLDDSIDLIITDINMPGIDGIEFIKQLENKYDVIIMTGNATLNRAIESVRLGVKDFLTKPFDINTLYETIKRVKLEREKIKSVKKIKNIKTNDDFINPSEALKKVLNIALKAAKTDTSIMIMGESGAGKEVFAKYIHKNSNRKDKPFVAINMAAIPENLIESELFGYEKGAFTDAIAQKIGQFELANGGTLFLDEIGEMPINLQPKLLRALQEREITRLGSLKSIKVDVRILCATNANLQNLIEDGKFRQDLYYRLNTIPILIPPLKDRKEEIIPISKKTLENICKKYSLEEKELSEEAMEELLSYDYPGNIRELISIIERAAILSEDRYIKADDLFIQSRKKKEISEIKKDFFVDVISSVDFNLNEASSILNLSTEDIKKLIKKYNLKEY